MSPATAVTILIVLLVNIDTLLSQPAPHSPANMSRNNFPAGFVFGTASSAYQYEGAANDGGRGPSVWDTVSHTPGAIADNSTGDVAVDQYHRYQEDIGLMTNVGFDAYRFSISWSRIFPDGRGPAPNAEGVAYYNRLINGLLAKGIQPYVTLYHWDLPQALEDDFGGWLSPQIVPLFAAYAQVCFAAFGDRVKFWITFNEPHGFATGQTNEGCRNASGSCGPGYFYSQVYQVGHHVILSHAAAVTTYRTKYQTQKGRIGISLDITWFEPLSSTSFADMVASERMQAFQVGWFLDPMFLGDYPLVMRKYIGNRLPYFSKEESQAVKGTLDFVGVNHYTTYYVTNKPPNSTLKYGIIFDDPRVEVSGGHDSLNMFGLTSKKALMEVQCLGGWILGWTAVKNGVLIGPMAASSWLRIVPWGIQKALNHVRVAYNNPPIYITENGMDELSDPSVPPDQYLRDDTRIRFYHDYLTYVLAAIRDGTDIRGHFAWSLLDNFEWNDGFSKRFGLYFVDYARNLTRIPRASVSWYTELLRGG